MFCDCEINSLSEMPTVWSSAHELSKKCDRLEETLNYAVGLLSGPGMVDEVEVAHSPSEAFDITRSKQALLEAVGNIVDIFTSIKLAYILERIERVRCGLV